MFIGCFKMPEVKAEKFIKFLICHEKIWKNRVLK